MSASAVSLPASATGLLVTNEDLEIVSADRLAAEILGVTVDELPGRTLPEILGSDMRLQVDLLAVAMFRATLDGRFVETTLRGERHIVRIAAAAVRLDDVGDGLFLTIEDVGVAAVG